MKDQPKPRVDKIPVLARHLSAVELKISKLVMQASKLRRKIQRISREAERQGIQP